MLRKHLAAFVVLICLLLGQRPHAQTGTARIFFVDIGQGAGTLIVSPTGRTLLVDGGPPGGGAKIGALLDTLGIATIDFTVVTHYHIDHDAGMIELLNNGRVAGIAYDNGDGPDVSPPGTSTAPNSTRGTYLNYVAATNRPGVTRQTIVPGQVIDLGGGMRATCLAAGGRLLSGGAIPITNDDLNTESISLLVEIGDFDYIVSGDLTGGGSTSTAKTPDIETYVGQLAGDVDVAQLNHHGSTTTSNQIYLSTIRAEVAVAQVGTTNTFGHPNRETVNKYLNTTTTAGLRFTGTGVPPAGVGPVFYQPEESPAGDDRVSRQGFTGASAANAGQGTVMLETDGVAAYTLHSFDDSGTRLAPGVHTYAIDGASPGATTDFAPTVVVQSTPVVPLATEGATVSAAVNDRESPIASVTLDWSVDGAAQAPIPMTPVGGNLFQAALPAQPDGARVEYSVSGTAGTRTTTSGGGYFSGTTPVASLRVLNPRGEPVFFGYGARIRGTVTAGANTFSAGTNDDYVQDATGGINVFRSSDTPTPFAATGAGQTVDVVGLIGFNGGRLRLDITETLEKTTSPYGITIVSPGPAPVPEPVTIATLLVSPESFEGRLVSIANSQIVAGSIPPTPQSLDAFVTVSDGTGAFILKVDKDTDVEGFNPGTTFTIVGVIQQDDFLRPFDAGYDVTPRGRVDLGGTPAGSELITIAAARVDAIVNADGTPGSDFVPDLLNQLVKVRGAVTSIDFRGGNGVEYYIQDATGGIDLFSSSLNAGPFAVGDSVEAIGAVTQFNGLTEIVVTSVALLAPGTIPAAAPQVVTLSQLADGGGGEALEGRLIRVDGVTITSGAFPAAGASGNVTITDATGSAALRVDSDTNIDGTAAPAGTFSVIGVLGQFDGSSPFDSGYQLFPRSTADIIDSGAVTITASPTSFDFGTVAPGGTAFTTVTITNPGTDTVTLTTPFTLAGANADQFAVGAPAAASLAAGASTTVGVTFLPTSPGAKSATLTIGSSIGSAVVALAGAGQAPTGAASPIVISEFRFRGPTGANDEFVELYNNTDAPVSIAGFLLRGSNSAGTVSTRATVPADTTIPARGHYLFVNGAAGAPNVARADQTYGTGITDDGGIALTLPDTTTFIDQVGLSAGSAFKEGTPPANLGTSNLDRGYERRAGGVNGSQQDTDDNAGDFQLTTPSDPQNRASTPTPAIRVSPTSIGFGTVVIGGGTATATLTMANLSTTATVTLNALSIDGPGAASFSVTAPGATTLAPGETTTAVVTFEPQAAGAHAATLTVPTGANGSVTVALSGAATGGIAVEPAALDFGSQSIGSLSSLTLAIANPGDTTITLSPPFVITGPNASEFFAGAPSTTTLGPGEAASLAVGFQPATVGPKSAALAVSSLNGGTRVVALAGQVACPTISISGALPAGIVGVPYLQTLVGNGGTAPYAFAVAGGGLPPGLQIDAAGTVAGSPTAGGTFAVTIGVTDANGCTGSAGYAIAVAAATLTATPSPVNFGAVAVGSSGTATLTITNTSAFAVTLVTPFGLSGSAQFSIGDPVTTALAPGASTTAPVTFTPIAAGVATATVSMASSGGGSAQASLSGTGRLASAGNGLVISELRFRGPSGASDEFVELYNASSAPIDISGYRLLGSNAAGTVSVRATVPAGRTVPARGHYLFTNSSTNGYSGATPGDQTYTTGITDDGGVAIALASGTPIDQVGLSAGSAYGEGAALASLGSSNLNRSYERKPGGANGGGSDTGDNASDFSLVSPSDPQSLASAITPALSLSPAVIDLGATPREATATATLTITNDSTADVPLTTPFTIAGPDAALFSVGAPGASMLPGGGATTVQVSFAPAAAGARTATLTIATAAGETHDVALAGLGVNAAPTANPQSVTTIEDTPLAIVLTGSDPEHDPLTFQVVAGPGHGSLSGAAPNLIYTPALDFSGPDSFTFKVNDGDVDSPVATVSITVVAALGVTTTAPNGGEKVFTNVPVTIRWMAAGVPTAFDVALSRNGGGTFTPIGSCTALPGAARSCVWTPTGPATTTALVRVTARDATGAVVQDASDAPFAISTATPALVVTSPLVTLGWAVGTRRTIEWSHNLGANACVRVELSRNGGGSWEVLTPSVRNTTATAGAFAWVVTGPTTTSARVRVTWLDGPASDTSDLPFRIVAPEILVLSPTLNVQWRIGSRQTIAWAHNLGTDETVRLEISRDGGATWALLSAGVPNQTGVLGGFEWTVTGPATTTARIRVLWTGDGAVQDASDTNFRIRQ